jgi:pantoate--beta-alanine ligase
MKIVRTIGELGSELHGEVGLVPTMGALHAGHLSLFAEARAENEIVVASLFVNAAQFGEQVDLASYPRDEAADATLAEEAGVDILFVPTEAEIYPARFATWVDVGDAGAEGAARSGHFRGVATICVKLFNIVKPRRAYFGQKDAQQAIVVRRVVRDLNIDVQIRVLPTVRDEDGLALSSRNARLSDEEHARALALPRALAAGAREYGLGGDAVAATRNALNGLTPDYVELIDLDGVTILATAAKVGATRLIDNVILEGELT